MRTVEQHLAAVLNLVEPLPPRALVGRSALGLVLADDLVARLPVPPFVNSAMDGFAVRASDVADATDDNPVALVVQGDIPAGAVADQPLQPGHAFRIMTGAPAPEGADAVVPVELTDQPRGAVPLPAHVAVRTAVEVGRHLREAGADSRPGNLVAQAGSVVSPALLSSAASTGFASLRCRPRPQVWVISSGAELVDPGAKVGPGQIPDSNGWLLAGLVEQFGADVVAVDRVDDEPAALRELLNSGPDVDLVVTTGGVSVGAFEVVRQVTEGAVEFSQVAMQPGKPQGAGHVRVGEREVALLALPGNPVSVFVSAWLFVRAALATLAGRDAHLATSTLPAGQGWPTPPARRQYLPAIVVDGHVVPAHAGGSGSHLVAGLHRAEVLAIVDESVTQVAVGDTVKVIDVRTRVW